MERRTFLATGLSACVALAGCSGNGNDSGGGDGTGDGGTGDGGSSGTSNDGSDGGSTDGGGSTPTATPGSDEQTLDTHPAARSLDTQPLLGPAPADATGVIVSFEDPSCPSCARFEREVVPQIKSQLVDPGTVSMVFRGYPVIYPWGEPAVRALEATFDRDEDAFWTLLNHYFGNQGEFKSAGKSEVYPKTEAFLAESTDLDAATVVSEAESGAYEGAVQTDLDAGKAAGAGRTTPHLFLFRDGVYQTKVQGLVSYQLIKSALGL